MNSRTQVRVGFTLVELLVVTGILASLLGLVVTGLRSGGSPSGQIRRSAQTLASAMIAAQSRSLGRPEGAGVIIDPTGIQGQTVSEALMYPFVTGSVSGLPPSNLAQPSVPVSVVADNAAQADLVHSYKILLSRAGDPVQPPSAWLGCSLTALGSGTIRLRVEAGQTMQNTIWPKIETAVYATIGRYPDKSGSNIDLEKQAAIDLRYSGVGDDPTLPYGRFDNKGAIAVTFDRTGAIGEIMQQVVSTGVRSVTPEQPRQPIYFLVALRSDIESTTINVLAKQDAVWVTVFPLTARIAVSSNVPQAGTDAAALFAARANARQGIPIGK